MRSPALLPSSLANEVTATAAFGHEACVVGSLAVSDLNEALASLPIASISLSFGPLNVHVTAAAAELAIDRATQRRNRRGIADHVERLDRRRLDAEVLVDE